MNNSINNEYENENSQFNVKLDKLNLLRESWINVFAEKYDKTNQINDLINNTEINESMWEAIEDINEYRISWRLMTFRKHWKISFWNLRDVTWDLQLCFSNWNLKIDKNWELLEDIFIWEDNIDSYSFLKKYIDIWDIIWVSWSLFYTQKGELTLFVKELTLLTKILNTLPEKFHWIKDTETKFRKRYLDILLNRDVKEMVERRWLYFKAIRDFLTEKWFMEVDTPVLENTTWWADANPFQTHHKALDMDVFLRISAGELWQKRLMVAWFEKIFELWRIFRNEWISPEHAQDYSQVEMYWAYSDYRDMMHLVKDMYISIADKVYNSRKFNIRWFEVDFDQEWTEIDYTEIIKDKTWIDIFSSSDDEIIGKIKELNIKVDDFNRMRMIDYLWKHIRKSISWPAFLINEPKFMSPLAKSDIHNPEITHRFHVIIAWSEVWNWYSELNDPIDQEERFLEQQKMRDAWDDEAQMADYEFVEALKYWMPPTVWFGISERLFAFLEDKPIRECQIFPLMKRTDK